MADNPTMNDSKTTQRCDIFLEDLEDFAGNHTIESLRSYIVDARGDEYHFAILMDQLKVGVFCENTHRNASVVHNDLSRVAALAFGAQGVADAQGWYTLDKKIPLETLIEGVDSIFCLDGSDEQVSVSRPLTVDYFPQPPSPF